MIADAVPQSASEHPLSYGQRALWFLHQLAPESAAYNVFFAMRIVSDLNRAALRRAFQTLIDRHPSLRTTYFTRDGQPAQLIHEGREVHFEEIDASTWSTGELDERLVEAAHRPFDLEHDPLFRVHLFMRAAPQQHILLLSAHHIAIDLWSLVLVMNELRLMRPEEDGNAQAALPEPAAPYTDYIRWQSEMLAGEHGERLWEYWHKQLAGEPPLLKLPVDRPPPPVQTYRGASYTFKLDEQLTARLTEVAKTERATLYMLLLAAFEVLLHKYTAQEDVWVGSLASGRSRAEFKSIVGYFVNPIVLRANLTGNPTFTEFLRQVRLTVLAALKRQDYPFPLLIERLQPVRDPSRSPLFQAMFLLQRLHRMEDHNVPMFVMGEAGARMELAGHEVESYALQERIAQFELELIMVEAEGTLSGALRYNTDLFDHATIARMAGHFQTLLESIIANPEQRLADLSLLNDAEQHQLLTTWNDTRADYLEDTAVHQYFEAQADATPDAVALVFEDEELTYRELNERANQLARHLRTLGVGAETVIGIYMQRSPLMLVAMLGVLKAGGAYLPLDTAAPKERLIHMLEDTRPLLVLTEEHLSGELPERTAAARVLSLDAEWQRVAQEERVGNLATVALPGNTAYVIYTSGSTGRPKGTLICHRNLNNFLAAMNERLGSDAPGVWLAVTNTSFDISILELLWTLTRGFKVVIHAEQDGVGYAPAGESAAAAAAGKPMDFSLFYFASDEGSEAEDKYRLLLEGAKFADGHEFAAVWTPERHFHAFGGLYPNPSVTSAAIAAITERIGIRAGSVVLPLHNPIRVAEEWAVVDNLSSGRVAIAFASGWHSNDFVFAPENYATRKEVMSAGIESVRKLWRGETLTVAGGAGNELEVKIFPRPIQRDLPVWLTAAGSAETFRMAGEIGANVLTHLLGQSFEEVAEKIAIYREAWRREGHEGEGHVTLMLHTFVGRDAEAVREKVYEPFCNYLRSSVGLWRSLAQSMGQDVDSADFTESDMQELLARAFDRYFETSGLFGTPANCLRIVERLKAIGVTEVACLIDFGIDFASVMNGLCQLNLVRERSRRVAAHSDYSLPALVKRHGVTHLQCTPSLARMLLLDSQAKEALRSLKVLLVGGEAFPVSLAEELAGVVQGKMLNMYGPTETTIWSTVYEVRGAKQQIPIGRPVANTQIYILDHRLQPQPVGVQGELYIGGDGLARGYLNHPELTAEKFIPDPFSARAGARLYHTGDAARYLPDGQIEFLGRMDQQVKIRGYRIEPGEVESVLSEHAAVEEAVLVAREDASAGEVRLVAYLVTKAPLATGELRQFLKQKLPDYMIPSAFVALDAMPLTPNGKINRRALPAPSMQGTSAMGAADYVAPQTDLERTIAGIWQDALQVERLSTQDNFFDLGGHSLLMAQVHARLREVLQTEVPVIELFKYPTVSSLAKYFNQRQQQQQQPASRETEDRVKKRKEMFNRRRQLTKGM
ncbi:MAG TPA: MupA/Atu3671 family FMN-dependent luciferase-like monooxygenase [Pyrinomonadaceae bacterium]|jgi:natural product biosynthesis luciferase-like monooxygenase protein